MHTHLNNILRLHYCCWNQMKWTIVTISWFWERERERKDINFEFTLLLYLREFIANSLLRRHLSVCFRKNRIWFERNRCVKHMPVFHNSKIKKTWCRLNFGVLSDSGSPSKMGTGGLCTHLCNASFSNIQLLRSLYNWSCFVFDHLDEGLQKFEQDCF